MVFFLGEMMIKCQQFYVVQLTLLNSLRKVSVLYIYRFSSILKVPVFFFFLYDTKITEEMILI